MSKKTIVIWGAGRIGRGLVADLFSEAGYRLVLVRRSSDFISRLRKAGRYAVVRTEAGSDRQVKKIERYTALSTAQSEELSREVTGAELVCVPVLPGDLPQVARQLASCLLRRRKERPRAPLDVLVSSNLVHAGPKFRALLVRELPPEAHQYLKSRVGIVETLAMRAAIDPPPDIAAEDPLQVWTSGPPALYADRHAFKGPIPDSPHLYLVDDIRARSARKIFFGNMLHSLVAYHGALRGYEFIAESIADAEVRAEAKGALAEADRALRAEYGLAPEELSQHAERLLTQMSNSALGDTVKRVGSDPKRKLGREDRLVGPTLLARLHGIPPTHLVRAIAAALWFDPGDDAGAAHVQRLIAEIGLPAAVREVCGLTEAERDLVEDIVRAYHHVCPARI